MHASSFLEMFVHGVFECVNARQSTLVHLLVHSLFTLYSASRLGFSYSCPHYTTRQTIRVLTCFFHNLFDYLNKLADLCPGTAFT